MSWQLALFRIRRAVIALLFGTLSACVGPAREDVSSFSSIGGNEIVVVGRIDLVPPLRKGEQKLEGIGTGKLENKIFVIADDHYRVLKQEPGVADYTGRVEATIGQTFFVRSRDKSFFILGAMMYLEIGGARHEMIYFPGGLKVTVKPGDRAIYIGTLRYERNEFFEITKANIVDEFNRANVEFQRKFGKKVPLRKSLMTVVKG